jgi:Icc-related predicted phosphoesterase
MAEQRTTRVMCAADPRGDVEALERMLGAAEASQVQAVALVGDLKGDRGGQGYRDVFNALGESGLPAFWVPGPEDAPVATYLREAYNMELVFTSLHGVHGGAAFAPGPVLFAGIGGEVSDDPDGPRDEQERLRYPRWEAEYRLKLLRELKDYELVLLFSTPPAHKGLDRPGSEALAELVATYRARLVVCGGERGTELIGRTLVVAPGSLADGHYAVADLHEKQADLEELKAAAS